MLGGLLRAAGVALLLAVPPAGAARGEDPEPEPGGESTPAEDPGPSPGPPPPQLSIVGRPTPADEPVRKSAVRDVLAPTDPVAEPTSLLGVVEGLPGVGANGQGGLLQGYSIRGLGRQRTLTMVGGVPIITDRRAGASGSFFDPRLMGGVQVRRGAASTEYGSGALGGVVDASPRHFEGPTASFGWRSDNDEWYAMAGNGSASGSIGASYRHAHDSEAADGTALYSRFEQWNVSLQRRWQLGERELEVFGLQSMANDIGKASTDYPARTTTYPHERHFLGSVTLRSRNDWLVRAFAHPNSLDTTVEQAGGTSEVKSDAFDMGLHAVRWVQLGGGTSAQAGFDYVARRGVDSREDGVHTLDDAAQDEGALFASLSAPLGRATVAAGVRGSGFRQRNTGTSAITEWAGDGFLGASAPIGRGWSASVDLSTGTRLPTLGERFFTGTTGRGSVTANPDLDPERAYTGDLGLRWARRQGHLELHAFQSRVRRYIERIETAPDVFTFVNLNSGTIRGLEAEGTLHLDDRWSAYFRGHALDGRSDDGEHLADIPPDQIGIGLRYDAGNWGASTEYRYRRAKDDPGSGERDLDSADLLAASLWLRLNRHMILTIGSENLTDERYYTSADDKAPLAPGRLLFMRLDLSR